MKRSTFLKQVSGATISSLLIPSFLSSACRRDPNFEDFSYNGKILIIGAGAAGLYAGYLLKSKNIPFEILEASGVYGGRLGKRTDFGNFPIDLGAQWMHGKNHLLGDLLKSTKTQTTLDDSEVMYWFKNQLTDQLPDTIDIFEGDDLPDISYHAYARQKGLGEEYQYIIEAIAGDQGADADRLSVLYNNIESNNWSSGDEDYKFSETYFDFIDQHIAHPIQNHIRLNTIIREIDYAGDGVILTDSQDRTYSGEKVIVTVPITILKSNDIKFNPPLKAEKTEAFAKIGMDAGIKVFLRFSEKFFAENILGGKYCAAYIDDSIGKSFNDAVLMAFIMGKQAEYLSNLKGEDLLIQTLLKELDEMYEGRASKSFLNAHVQNWFTHPHIRGAYSYSTIGMGDARSIAAQSVQKKVYFAGEAMNLNGHHQTVQGAVETGYREVIQILKDIQK